MVLLRASRILIALHVLSAGYSHKKTGSRYEMRLSATMVGTRFRCAGRDSVVVVHQVVLSTARPAHTTTLVKGSIQVPTIAR